MSARKRVLSAFALLAIAATVVTAQTKDSTPPAGATNSAPRWGNAAAPVIATAWPAAKTTETADNSGLPRLVQPTVLQGNPPAGDIKPRVAAASASAAATLYDVGVGDVLDIRLANLPTRESTLFTVLKNGTIEYPLVAAPIAVAGMTTEEIARTLTGQIRVIKASRIDVSVRDYVSHPVLISGLVDNPGRQVLRREAMPLYAALAQAAVRAEATTVTIVHKGKEGPPLSLHDAEAMAGLIVSGDVIRVSGGGTPSQYVYVGGDVASPGEKSFREGMTLTQVLLASGAKPAAVSTVRIARRTGEGLLATTEYSLPSINQGKMPDPFLEPGDRIEVTRAF